MGHPLVDALRERLDFQTVLTGIALLAGLRLLFDVSAAQLAVTAAMGALSGLAEVTTDAYDLRESVKHGWFGAVGLVGGGAMALFAGESAWVGFVFLALGAWFVADAVQTVRHEGATVESPDGRTVYQDYLARRVDELVAEQPRTRRELHEAMDADPGDIDAAVDRLEDRGVVTWAGSELRPVDDDPGAVGRLRDRLGALARRVARPVTLELHEGSGGSRVGRSTANGTEAPPGTGAADADSMGEKGRSTDADDRELARE